MQCSACGQTLTGTPRYCPSCGVPVGAERADAGEPIEQPGGEKARAKSLGIVLFPLLLLGGVGVFFWYVNPSINSVIWTQPIIAQPSDYDTTTVPAVNIAASEDGADLVFPLATLQQNRFIRFEYNGGKTPRFVMAYIAPDGRMVTAMSVSEKCGSTEFVIKDNQIFCAHCPSHWDIMTMEAYACCQKYYPDPIPSWIQGNSVHVSKKVITDWASRL